MSDSVQPHRWQPARLPRSWDSPGKNIEVGCHCLLHYEQIYGNKLDNLEEMDRFLEKCNLPSLPGSSVHGILQARILGWVAIPFSRGSSQPRDWTWISCIAGRLFTVWAIREAPMAIWYFWAYEMVISEKCLNPVLVSASRLLFEDKHHTACVQHETSSPWVLRWPERQDSSLFSILRELL